MADRSWSDLIHSHSPELDEQNRTDMAFLKTSSALTSREKYLLAMALDAFAGMPNGARKYGERATQEGASKEQIVEALSIVRMFGGRGALATGCEALRQFESP